MAIRPVFIPKSDLSEAPGVVVQEIEFQWFPGMSKSQKQKSVVSLHKAAGENGICNILEVSSKSEHALGVELSAFNLLITTKKHGKVFSVESAFQASKVFSRGGPYLDLLDSSSKSAKRDIRLKESGDLIKFSFFNTEFALRPRTLFYDWLYVNALNQNRALATELLSYNAFTDIEFNPKTSINCQAYSAALYRSLKAFDVFEEALESVETFALLLETEYRNRDDTLQVQSGLL